MMLEEKLTQIESMFETGWDFFAKPYSDEDALKSFGVVTIDGEDTPITNHMMETVVELIASVRASEKLRDRCENDLRHDLKIARNERDRAREYAAMSDPRIGDALHEEVVWFEANQGQEDLVYGPVELMGYCRDRLRSR